MVQYRVGPSAGEKKFLNELMCQLLPNAGRDLGGMLDLALPNASRWRSITLKTFFLNDLLNALSRMTEDSTLRFSQLESFRVCAFDRLDIGHVNQAYPQNSMSRFRIFSCDMPSLTEAIIVGIHIDWGKLAPLSRLTTTKLVKLELGQQAEWSRPTREQLIQILKGAQLLESLSITSSGPIIHTGDTASHKPCVYLPALRNLRLASIQYEYATVVLSMLFAPSLSHLELSPYRRNFGAPSFVRRLTMLSDPPPSYS